MELLLIFAVMALAVLIIFLAGRGLQSSSPPETQQIASGASRTASPGSASPEDIAALEGLKAAMDVERKG
jgi:hypothetical protein